MEEVQKLTAQELRWQQQKWEERRWEQQGVEQGEQVILPKQPGLPLSSRLWWLLEAGEVCILGVACGS